MKRPFYTLLLAAATWLSACNQTDKAADTVTAPAAPAATTDSTARIHTDRIVSVSKQLTEMIFALGAGDHLVGRDLSSSYPPEAKKLTSVGYHRLLNAEGIISLKPSVVFHDGNIAPEAVLTQVAGVGIPLQEFPSTKTIPETEQLLRRLGQLFGKHAQADTLCRRLAADMQQAEKARQQYADKPKVVIIHYGMQKNIYLAMGQKNLASQLLEWAGATNSLQATEGMKPISSELIAEAQPDVILATDFGFDRTGGLEAFKKLPGVALTPAAKNNRIYRVEEHDMVYLGPRTGQVVLQLQKLIHQTAPRP
ncbi:ABC transporter substrate-binding protein [Hymenobacter busanensis]|uniref:ABC transporter substrate-binding protein n=1 Tax=Hymenobacter busanensis TaxID=2607656 RepID=A0A7L4ZWN0_9BACT|nr:ABC transporter substrate-binding protein [Hymenobacter busanensis]KAA9332225.1 ABC transporter substrate-binding protein [Hymenobacter busanensis]QHJ07437.1 ABC transporter substrate-binding protein [Hymenobacter busanensis]